MKFSAVMIGDDRVMQRLNQLSPKTVLEVERSIGVLLVKLQSKVKDEKLSGQILKNKTGTLRRSVNRNIVKTGKSIIGSVGTNIVYGRVHELGGTITVREHLRMMVKAFGRAVKNPRQITVKSHQATYPERSFLRSSLREMESEIKGELKDALRRSVIQP